MLGRKKTPKRTREEILAEYGQVCAQIGENEYRLKVGIPLVLEDLYAKAKQLNLEAAAAQTPAKE